VLSIADDGIGLASLINGVEAAGGSIAIEDTGASGTVVIVSMSDEIGRP
jgi:signal transduction histidine kinase